jgi:hypothetical protein
MNQKEDWPKGMNSLMNKLFFSVIESLWVNITNPISEHYVA